jgi:hypothetical protein
MPLRKLTLGSLSGSNEGCLVIRADVRFNMPKFRSTHGTTRRGRALILALCLLVASTAGLAAPASGAQVNCSSAARLTYAPVSLPNGLTFTSVVVSNAVTEIASTVVLHPGSGQFYNDNWSVGWDAVSSSYYFYFAYNKLANPGVGYFQVEWCLQ